MREKIKEGWVSERNKEKADTRWEFLSSFSDSGPQQEREEASWSYEVVMFCHPSGFPSLFIVTLFWCSANGYPELCFLFCFLCLWPSSTMTIWGKARIKVGVMYWNGVSHYVSWSFHFSDSFSWNKWSLQCPRTTAFTAWNLFLVGLNVMIQDLKNVFSFFFFRGMILRKNVCIEYDQPLSCLMLLPQLCSSSDYLPTSLSSSRKWVLTIASGKQHFK